MAMTISEWRRANPDGEPGGYEEYLRDLSERARIANEPALSEPEQAAIELAMQVLARRLGHYGTDEDGLSCLLDGTQLGTAPSGTLLQLFALAIAHERRYHA